MQEISRIHPRNLEVSKPVSRASRPFIRSSCFIRVFFLYEYVYIDFISPFPLISLSLCLYLYSNLSICLHNVDIYTLVSSFFMTMSISVVCLPPSPPLCQSVFRICPLSICLHNDGHLFTRFSFSQSCSPYKLATFIDIISISKFYMVLWF